MKLTKLLQNIKERCNAALGKRSKTTKLKRVQARSNAASELQSNGIFTHRHAVPSEPKPAHVTQNSSKCIVETASTQLSTPDVRCSMGAFESHLKLQEPLGD